jgi:hypothetical protein
VLKLANGARDGNPSVRGHQVAEIAPGGGARHAQATDGVLKQIRIAR